MGVLDTVYPRKKAKEWEKSTRSKILECLNTYGESRLGIIVEHVKMDRRIILKTLGKLIKIKRVKFKEVKEKVNNNTLRLRKYSINK